LLIRRRRLPYAKTTAPRVSGCGAETLISTSHPLPGIDAYEGAFNP
jgi:hypothetical protein